MSACAFFGHRNFDYRPYEDNIREIVVELINKGVTDFYNGYRGNFDETCARIVCELHEQYPQIKNIMVLSYPPTASFVMPKCFDRAVYLLTRSVPPKSAIVRTNKLLVKTVSYVVSGVVRGYGGAKIACDFAKTMFRSVINVVTGDTDYYLSEHELEMGNKILQEHLDRLATDEEYKRKCEEESKRIYEKTAPIVEKQIEKNKRKKPKRDPVWVNVETKTTED